MYTVSTVTGRVRSTILRDRWTTSPMRRCMYSPLFNSIHLVAYELHSLDSDLEPALAANPAFSIGTLTLVAAPYSRKGCKTRFVHGGSGGSRAGTHTR